MQRRSLIFVVISVLLVALVYSSFTPFILYAAPYDPGWRSSQDCTITSFGGVLCCWTESGAEYCQTCVRIPEGTPGTEEGGWECTTKEKSLEQPPTPPPFGPTATLQGVVLEQLDKQPSLPAPPTTGESILPEDGVLEQPPTPPPFGPAAPLQGGVLEQPPSEGGVTQPADQGTGSEVPRTAEPLPPTCTPGSVFDPDINECVLENPPELCPDGSIPQLTGPGGMQPECPPSEAEEPQAEEPEQPAAEDPEQQPSEEGDGSSEDNGNNN